MSVQDDNKLNNINEKDCGTAHTFVRGNDLTATEKNIRGNDFWVHWKNIRGNDFWLPLKKHSWQWLLTATEKTFMAMTFDCHWKSMDGRVETKNLAIAYSFFEINKNVQGNCMERGTLQILQWLAMIHGQAFRTFNMNTNKYLSPHTHVSYRTHNNDHDMYCTYAHGIQFLAWNRHTNVAELNRLIIGSQTPSW